MIDKEAEAFVKDGAYDVILAAKIMAAGLYCRSAVKVSRWLKLQSRRTFVEEVMRRLIRDGVWTTKIRPMEAFAPHRYVLEITPLQGVEGQRAFWIAALRAAGVEVVEPPRRTSQPRPSLSPPQGPQSQRRQVVDPLRPARGSGR